MTSSSLTLRVFLSSTAVDLGAYREAVKEAVLRLHHLPIRMETFGALATAPLTACERQVRDSDAVVVLVAHRYGWVPTAEQGGREGKSITWLEVEAALDAGRPIFAYLVEDAHPWIEDREQDRLLQPEVLEDPSKIDEVVRSVRELQRFKGWLRSQSRWTLDFFTTPEDLATKVTAALASWAMSQPTPALKLSFIRVRSSSHMLGRLNALGYDRDRDVRESSAARELFIEEPSPEEVPSPGDERPLVRSRSVALLTGDSGQGKSWQLYRLGYELAQEEELAILIQGTGAVTSDLEAVAGTFCREIWESGSMKPLREIRDMMRRELPEIQEPWLTVLIDDVRDDEYALSLLQYPWRELGLRVVLTCRSSDRFAREGEHHVVQVTNFTVMELSRYLKIRLGVDWMDFPTDVMEYLKIPLLARLFCDLQGGGTTWRPVNEYSLFERVWAWQTAKAPLAASALAGLAARLLEEQVYPWPVARVWTTGFRDMEVKALADSGLLRLVTGGRSLDIWLDRILNWAVAEGLVSALRTGEITAETLVSRAIQEPGDGPLRYRLGYIALDTLWLLTIPELGLDDAVRQFLTALETRWEYRSILQNLHTLGPRIVPHLISHLAAGSSSEGGE
ncbi:MAG TPA: DUF4062 domain-containing protein [Thermoanaerobaculia bacterium]